MIAFSGDWERGVAMTQRAIELNRHHPGWYQLVLFHHQYRKSEYQAAWQTAKKINMPEFHWMQLMTRPPAACWTAMRKLARPLNLCANTTRPF